MQGYHLKCLCLFSIQRISQIHMHAQMRPQAHNQMQVQMRAQAHDQVHVGE